MREGRKRSSLFRDVSLMLPARVLLLVASVATSTVIARELGPSGRGTVAVAFSLTLLLAQLGAIGVTAANPFYLAREPALRGSLIANSLVLGVGLGLLFAAIGLGVRLLAPDLVRGLDTVDLLIALTAVPALLVAQFLQSVLLGEGRTVAYNVVEVAVTLATLAILVVLAVAASMTPRGALVVLAAGRLATAAAFVVAVRQPAAGWRVDPQLARRMLAYGLRVYAATMLAYLVIRIDLLMVNAYLGPAQAGLYAVAVALADALYILPSVVAVNLFAHVARGAADETSARAFRAISVLYAAVVGLAALVAGPVVTLLYGAPFADAAGLFRWLAPGIFCLGMLNILAQHFAGRGFPIEAVLVWVVGLALNVALNLVLLPGGPTSVAALSSSVTYVLLLVLHARMFARTMGYRSLCPDPAETLALLRGAVARLRSQPGST